MKKIYRLQKGIKNLEHHVAQGTIPKGLEISVKINLPSSLDTEKASLNKSIREFNKGLCCKMLGYRKKELDMLLTEKKTFTFDNRSSIQPLLTSMDPTLSKKCVKAFDQAIDSYSANLDVRLQVTHLRNAEKARIKQAKRQQDMEDIIELKGPVVKEAITKITEEKVRELLRDMPPASHKDSSKGKGKKPTQPKKSRKKSGKNSRETSKKPREKRKKSAETSKNKNKNKNKNSRNAYEEEYQHTPPGSTTRGGRHGSRGSRGSRGRGRGRRGRRK